MRDYRVVCFSGYVKDCKAVRISSTIRLQCLYLINVSLTQAVMFSWDML